jgi:hypothetical protein
MGREQRKKQKQKQNVGLKYGTNNKLKYEIKCHSFKCFLYVLYCSNSCTSLHFKILKSHTKTLKICPYMFRSPLKPSSGGPWPYCIKLLIWNVDLHLL